MYIIHIIPLCNVTDQTGCLGVLHSLYCYNVLTMNEIQNDSPAMSASLYMNNVLSNENSGLEETVKSQWRE